MRSLMPLMLLLAMLSGAGPVHGATPPADETARNLAVLERYGDLGRQREYAQQAALWAPNSKTAGSPGTR